MTINNNKKPQTDEHKNDFAQPTDQVKYLYNNDFENRGK